MERSYYRQPMRMLDICIWTTGLVARGVVCGAGHFYALGFPRLMELEARGGFTRLGFFHYNTMAEVATVCSVLRDLAGSQ